MTDVVKVSEAQRLANRLGETDPTPMICIDAAALLLKQEAALKLATDALQWIESCSSFSGQYVRSGCNKKATEALTAIKEMT